MILISGVFALTATALALIGCGANNSSGDDDLYDAPVDVDCSCDGLTKMIYDECNGNILSETATMTSVEFTQSCLEAIANGGDDASTYKCYIGAACSANNCEDGAKFLNLCNI